MKKIMQFMGVFCTAIAVSVSCFGEETVSIQEQLETAFASRIAAGDVVIVYNDISQMWSVKLLKNIVGPFEILDNLKDIELDINGYDIKGPDGANGDANTPGEAGQPAILFVKSDDQDHSTRLNIISAGGFIHGGIYGGHGGDGSIPAKGGAAITAQAGAANGLIIYSTSEEVYIVGGNGGKGIGEGVAGADGAVASEIQFYANGGSIIGGNGGDGAFASGNGNGGNGGNGGLALIESIAINNGSITGGNGGSGGSTETGNGGNGGDGAQAYPTRVGAWYNYGKLSGGNGGNGGNADFSGTAGAGGNGGVETHVEDGDGKNNAGANGKAGIVNVATGARFVDEAQSVTITGFNQINNYLPGYDTYAITVHIPLKKGVDFTSWLNSTMDSGKLVLLVNSALDRQESAAYNIVGGFLYPQNTGFDAAAQTLTIAMPTDHSVDPQGFMRIIVKD